MQTIQLGMPLTLEEHSRVQLVPVDQLTETYHGLVTTLHPSVLMICLSENNCTCSLRFLLCPLYVAMATGPWQQTATVDIYSHRTNTGLGGLTKNTPVQLGDRVMSTLKKQRYCKSKWCVKNVHIKWHVKWARFKFSLRVSKKQR